ncbi:MAG: hypothetical protein PHQ47_01580 [Candidatus Portnoybacteria bacterium]|nr:hypothetical protein [Candidatus Portnoybacteria bacterium]
MTDKKTSKSSDRFIRVPMVKYRKYKRHQARILKLKAIVKMANDILTRIN